MLMAATLVSQAQKPHCKGTKADGTPCRMVIINKAGYCHYHDPSAVHCAFVRKDGTHCKNVVKNGETLCRFHKPE